MLILSYIFLTSAVLILFFRIVITLAFQLYKESSSKKEKSVSWIICAKNEADNLKKNIDKWLVQKHADWELIIVLDRCTDNSSQIVISKIKEHPNLKLVVNTESKFPGKRNALIAGAEYAAHDNIILSDADCIPTSDYWLSIMSSKFDNKTDFVIGFSPYSNKTGFLNKLIRMETLQTAMLYGAATILGKPYMAVGRNLGIKKQYLSAKYFQNHQSISGDDDLLVNHFANKNNTKLCVQPKAYTISEPKNTWKDFLKQKQRHSGTGTYYTLSSQAILFLYYISLISFYLLGIFTSLFIGMNHYLFYIFVSVLVFNMLTLILINHRLKFRLSLAELLITDFCISFFLISLGFLSRRQVRKW